MNTLVKLKNIFSKNTLFCIFYFMITFLFAFTGFMLICYPETAGLGVSVGIKTCLGSLLPSLFPFMFISTVMINLNLFDKSSSFCEKLMRFVFALPGRCAFIIFMSLIGGFPVGAMLVKQAFEKGHITANEGKRLLLFCVNPGPAFAVSTVGVYMLGSKKSGLIIYASLVVSALIIGVLSRFLDDEDDFRLSACSEDKVSFGEAVTRSVNSCVHSTLNICAWVVFFSCIGAITDILPISENSRLFLKIITEVTNGSKIACEYFSLPMVCAVIGFSGLCIHLQVLPAVVRVRLNFKHFFTARIIHAALSSVITVLILKLFNESVEVVSFGVKPQDVTSEASVCVSVALMLMCGLFVLGDNFVIKRRKKMN